MLPDYSVVHKQDWFIKERYKPELQKDDKVTKTESGELGSAVSAYIERIQSCLLYTSVQETT